MHTFVAMIRGINVAGSRPLKMDKLRGLCEALGFRGVRTYLQSGNVVFCAPGAGTSRHAVALEGTIRRECGFDVSVAVVTSEALTAAAGANPFLGRPAVDPRFLHMTFLIRPEAEPSLGGGDLPLAQGERSALAGEVVYLYCPHGYENTKINNAFFERRLSARATTRNWQTVTALDRMARSEST
jgi:uncharacterized protein (DUF1697 family)